MPLQIHHDGAKLAIGIGGFNTCSCITENDLRQEHGIALRGRYD